MPAIRTSNAIKERENARDRALMKEIASGDSEVLEKLFKYYNERIYRSCLHLCRNTEDAVDATQESFVRVFNRLQRGETEITSFRDYLFMTSHNICMQMIALRKRAFPTDDLSYAVETGHIDANDDPERSALITDQREIVRKASAELPRRQLNALKLHEIGGLEYVEIGRAMGLQKNAVAQLILRARQRLKSEMKIAGTAENKSSEICAKATVMLPSLASESLTERESIWLERHLEACRSCRANLDVMEEVGASYRSLSVPTALLFERIFHDKALAGTFFKSAKSGVAQFVTNLVISNRKLATYLLAATGLLVAATATVDLVKEEMPVGIYSDRGKYVSQDGIALSSQTTTATATQYGVVEYGGSSSLSSPGSDHEIGGFGDYLQAGANNLVWVSPLSTLFSERIDMGRQALVSPGSSSTAQVSSVPQKKAKDDKKLIPYSTGSGYTDGPLKLHSYLRVNKLSGLKIKGKQPKEKGVVAVKVKKQKYKSLHVADADGISVTNNKPPQTTDSGKTDATTTSTKDSTVAAKTGQDENDKKQNEKKEAEKSSKEEEEKKAKASGEKGSSDAKGSEKDSK